MVLPSQCYPAFGSMDGGMYLLSCLLIAIVAAIAVIFYRRLMQRVQDNRDHLIQVHHSVRAVLYELEEVCSVLGRSVCEGYSDVDVSRYHLVSVAATLERDDKHVSRGKSVVIE